MLLPYILSSQLCFEKVYFPSGVDNIRIIDESFDEYHLATSSGTTYYIKNINENSWKMIDFGSLDIATWGVIFGPNSEIYVRTKDHDIFVSYDKGESFSQLNLPVVSEYPQIKILNSETLIFYTYTGIKIETFYSLDKGINWTKIEGLSLNEIENVKIVDDKIILVYWGSGNEAGMNVFELNTTTQISNRVNVGYDEIPEVAILDNGTVYVALTADPYNNDRRLFKYTNSSGLEDLGVFSEIAYLTLSSAGNDLIVLSSFQYYVFSGLEFIPYTYCDGTSTASKRISHNGYVYTNKFRSTEPLTFSQLISGTINYDEDSNCELNIGEDKFLAGWLVEVENDNFYRLKSTDLNGYYEFSVPYGEYSVSVIESNDNWEICNQISNVVIDEIDDNVSQNVLAKALNNCAGINVNLSAPLLRRCFDNSYTINVFNQGPSDSENTNIEVTLDQYFEFSSSSIPSTQIDEQVYKFELGSIKMNELVRIKIYFNISCDAELGISHCMKVKVLEDDLCDNEIIEYSECQNNIGSFDPNDKRIFSSEGIESSTFEKEDFIYYHIRFQNTGTDTAFTVLIEDVLSDKLDKSTFEMLGASHDYVYQINDTPTLVVKFDDILLVDSTTNEVNSHGYFKFKIKPISNIQYGTEIPNSAAIYFDFNEPVITNNAVLTIENPLSVLEKDLDVTIKLSPNPVFEELEIVFDKKYELEIEMIEIYNLKGEKVYNGSPFKNVINVETFTAGMYYLVAKNNKSVLSISKFIKI